MLWVDEFDKIGQNKNCEKDKIKFPYPVSK